MNSSDPKKNNQKAKNHHTRANRCTNIHTILLCGVWHAQCWTEACWPPIGWSAAIQMTSDLNRTPTDPPIERHFTCVNMLPTHCRYPSMPCSLSNTPALFQTVNKSLQCLVTSKRSNTESEDWTEHVQTELAPYVWTVKPIKFTAF